MFLTETDNFGEVLAAYRRRFLKLTDENLGEFGGDLIDLGFPIYFESGSDFFNVVTGPMKKEQSEQFFGEIDIPNTGIFVDVDFFRNDLSPKIGQMSVLALLSKGIKKAQEIATLINNWIVKPG